MPKNNKSKKQKTEAKEIASQFKNKKNKNKSKTGETNIKKKESVLRPEGKGPRTKKRWTTPRNEPVLNENQDEAIDRTSHEKSTPDFVEEETFVPNIEENTKASDTEIITEESSTQRRETNTTSLGEYQRNVAFDYCLRIETIATAIFILYLFLLAPLVELFIAVLVIHLEPSSLRAVFIIQYALWWYTELFINLFATTCCKLHFYEQLKKYIRSFFTESSIIFTMIFCYMFINIFRIPQNIIILAFFCRYIYYFAASFISDWLYHL